MTPGAPPPQTHEVLASIRDIIETVDARATQMNRKWGFNRLAHLVPLDWKDRFRSQKRKWEMACFECAGSPRPDDLVIVRKHGEAMLRAYEKLDELASQNGYEPGPADHWEFELQDGTPIVLVRERTESSQIDRDGSKVQIWSLEEIAAILAKWPELVLAKTHFPDAEVIQTRTSPIVVGELDDQLADLPWA